MNEKKNNWQPGETFPRYGEVFIAKIKGCPWPVLAAWNGVYVVHTMMKCDMGGSDCHFVSEWGCEIAVEAWHPMPRWGGVIE